MRLISSNNSLNKLSEMFKDDPAMHQWASALIGGVVAEIVANNAQAGASTAASGTKNNLLWEYIPEFRKSIKDVDVSDLPEGYCRILAFGASMGEVISGGISDAAIIFNTPGNDVYSSTDITGSAGFSTPVNIQAGVGWLEDSSGNVVTDPDVIREQMQGFSYTASGVAGGGIGNYLNGKGYTFKVKFISSSVSFVCGGSYTKYLGKKNDVANGDF